jgi:hypothetical protein
LEWEGQSLNKTYQGRSDATVAQRWGEADQSLRGACPWRR